MQRGLVGVFATSRKFATWKRRCVGASGWRTWRDVRGYGHMKYVIHSEHWPEPCRCCDRTSARMKPASG